MAQSTSSPQKQMVIPYFDGVNASVGHNLAKKQEFRHVENARSFDIGISEKREGAVVIGNRLAATREYGIFFFENTDSFVNNRGLYRISTVAGVTNIYYLNSSNIWTALVDVDSINLFEINSSTTQFDVTNPSGTTFRYTYDGTGTDPAIGAKLAVGATITIAGTNLAAGNQGTFVITNVDDTSPFTYFEVTNASGVVESNKTIGGGSIVITGRRFSDVNAEECLFLVNGITDNRYIDKNGTSVVTSATAPGHLYFSPKARKINYYKDKLYIADYLVGNTRYRNSIMQSSVPLGIVSLVDGDHPAGSNLIVKVTDTKYIRVGDNLAVFRGFVEMGVLVVTAKTEDTITVNAMPIALLSADELWVESSYTGIKKFRWPDNPTSGINVKQYDTFKLSGGRNDRITMLTNIGDVMVIANSSNMATWDDYTLRSMDIGIGCVSDESFVKHLGSLWFLGRDGVYATAGDRPKLMSIAVEKYIKGAIDLSTAAMGKKDFSIFASIGDVNLYNDDGSFSKLLEDVTLEYDLRKESWFIHTGIGAKMYRTFINLGVNADTLAFTGVQDNVGYNVYEFLAKNQQTDTFLHSTEVSNIPYRVDTPRLYLSAGPDTTARPQEVIIEADRGTSIRCFISLDGAPFYEVEGETSKGMKVLKLNSNTDEKTNPRCRYMQLSLRDFSGNICKVSRVTVKYVETLERELERPEGFSSISPTT